LFSIFWNKKKFHSFSFFWLLAGGWMQPRSEDYMHSAALAESRVALLCFDFFQTKKQKESLQPSWSS
jgi:hypothetical protein